MEANSLPNSLKAKRRIVVGVDFEELGASAMRSALALGSSVGDTEVHVVYVRSGTSGSRLAERDLSQIEADIERLRLFIDESVEVYKQAFGEAPQVQVFAHRTAGNAAEELNRFAVALRASMIIVGTHGRKGLKRAVLGSVAEAVVRNATCPVLVMRPITHPLADDRVGDEAEPACPDCDNVRQTSGGKELWCPRHAGHHGRAEAYAFGGGGGSPTRPWGFS